MSIAPTLRNCAVKPPVGSTRLVSSNADGIMVAWGVTIVGPYVDNCQFVSLEDDGINVHAGSVTIDDILDDGLRVQPEWLLEPNSELYITDSMTGQVKAVAKTMERDGKQEFHPPLPASIITRKHLKSKATQSVEAHLRPFQIERTEKPDQATISRGQYGGTILANSIWTNIRGHGVQLTSPSVWVENCTFDTLTGNGISVTSLMSWGLYYSTRNSVIRNCKIRNTGGQGIIVKCIPPYEKGSIHVRSINSVLIENNIIGPCRGTPIRLDNCFDIQVTGNRFIGDNASINPPEGNIGRIIWKDNTIEGLLK